MNRRTGSWTCSATDPTGSGSTTTTGDHSQQNETPKDAPLATGLLAPSDLVVSDVTATTLTLSWRDNSTREWGAAVYRMDPVVARRDPTKGWKLLTQVPEAVESNWAGTGMRSDSDFDLTPGTNYCYRVRAYVGFSMSEVSAYSKAVCIRTSDLPESTEQCSNESRRLCESRRATCEVEHARNGSSSDLCRWDSISSASACSETAGIWTTEGSRFSQGHYRLYFGLAHNTLPPEIEVKWPDGRVQLVRPESVDRLLTIRDER